MIFTAWIKLGGNCFRLNLLCSRYVTIFIPVVGYKDVRVWSLPFTSIHLWKVWNFFCAAFRPENMLRFKYDLWFARWTHYL